VNTVLRVECGLQYLGQCVHYRTYGMVWNTVLRVKRGLQYLG
jgi:hypothetical protein